MSAVCAALEVSRATWYRHRFPDRARTAPGRPATQRIRCSPRSLPVPLRKEILAQLTSERFHNLAPRQMYAILLDEGHYLCSVSSMYRLLRQDDLACERRQRPPGNFVRPELLATGPNQVWSWDITKLKGPAKWTYHYLYVVMDVFSRYVVGWMVAERECQQLARQMITEACTRHGILKDQLILHADRGSAMTSRSLAELLTDLGVTKSHSRPHVSNDNPYSEAQFKTLKYHPDFPDRFGCVQDARQFCSSFFVWYNDEHRHSGLAWLTPEMVHSRREGLVLAQRQATLTAAYARHPERFNRPPLVTKLALEVWINGPPSESARSKVAAAAKRTGVP